jgi:hypothetical protein
MREFRALLGVALLIISCGGGGGRTADGGTGGSHGGSGGSGGVGGHATGTGGSGGNGASCPSVSPCGGNLVGTWKVTQTCLTATGNLGNLCDGGDAPANLAFSFSGTLTFNADGTYSSALTGSETAHEYFPSGCAPFGATCAQLGQQVIDGGSISCSLDSAGGCTCDSMAPARDSSQSGTYATSGSTVSTTHDGTTSVASYCVQGSVLYEIAGPGDGGVLTSMGVAVLTRQ